MINYANLTSGLEGCPADSKLVRIQSSHLEAQAYWSVLADLDYGFLFDAAIHGIFLYDCGSRRGEESRAQWYGVPWIIWAYERASMGCKHDKEPNNAFIGSMNVKNDFLKYFNTRNPLRDMAIKKLRYVWKMTNKQLTIITKSSKSTLDGNYEELSLLLFKHMEG
jgi:hypothetical protein